MHSNINLLATAAAVVSVTSAATIRIDVGNGGLVFSPNVSTAAVGDVAEFHFYPQKHNVVQTSFASPCDASNFTNPFYSGFMPVTSGEGTQVFQVTINDTKPIWFYCGQATHCESGMVGVINQPTTANTLDKFKAAAGKVTKASFNPTVVGGGVVVADSGSSSSSAGGSSPSSAGSSPGSSATTTSSSGSGGGVYGSGSPTSATTSSASPSSSKSAGDNVRAVRWSELLGMGIAVGGAAILMH